MAQGTSRSSHIYFVYNISYISYTRDEISGSVLKGILMNFIIAFVILLRLKLKEDESAFCNLIEDFN